MKQQTIALLVATTITFTLGFLAAPDADARFGAGGVHRAGPAGGSMHANRTRRMENRQDFRRDRWDHADDVRDDRREWADDRQRRRAAAYITGAALGRMNCQPNVMVGGMGYRNCGGQWYQPSYQNGTTVYVTVNAPPGY